MEVRTVFFDVGVFSRDVSMSCSIEVKESALHRRSCIMLIMLIMFGGFAFAITR